MPNPNPETSATKKYPGMPFLATHGLQSPLSAIRWGCGRLKKSGGNLSSEQEKLINDILRESKLLSKMFDLLLLLSKVDEGVHVPNVQDVYVNDLLMTLTTEDLPRKVQLDIECPADLIVRADRTLLTSVIQMLVMVGALGGKAGTIPFLVQSDNKTCSIEMRTPLTLSLLAEEGEENSIVGGVPGFLLATASALTVAMGGTLTPAKKGESIESIALKIPVQLSIVTLS